VPLLLCIVALPGIVGRLLGKGGGTEQLVVRQEVRKLVSKVRADSSIFFVELACSRAGVEITTNGDLCAFWGGFDKLAEL